MTAALNEVRNLLTLTVRQMDFATAAKQPELVSQLRRLTLGYGSGMNHELNWMLPAVLEENRNLNCQVLLAYRFEELVGWAILSKEATDFHFVPSEHIFNSTDGWLFEVYVDPYHRRQGIGSHLLESARKHIKDDTLCISPWDECGYALYKGQRADNTRWL